MNGARDKILPSSGFSFDESSRISRCDDSNEIQPLSESTAYSDDVLKAVVHTFAVHCLTVSLTHGNAGFISSLGETGFDIVLILRKKCISPSHGRSFHYSLGLLFFSGGFTFLHSRNSKEKL